MIDPASYQDTERYQNNISPEPTNISLINNQCYKTPIYQNVNTLIHNDQLPMHSLYPTPPSDNEESNHLTARLDLDNTPKLTENYYYSNLPSNNTSYEIKQSQNDIANKPDEITNDSSQNTHQTNQSNVNINNANSNRYKRRSRTTYSKTQLDTLESTFQKTHYPEIRVVDELSSMLNLSTERISIWFQNRRARFKKARKLENHQEIISPAAQYKSPNDSVYSAATSYGLAGAPGYPSSNLDKNYLLNSIDKNPLKLLNHQLIAEKLNLNKYLPSIQETNSYNMISPSNTFYHPSHYSNPISNEQNHNSYQHLSRNETSPIANYPMTSVNNLQYQQASNIVQ